MASDFKAAMDIQRIKTVGGTAQLSIAQVTKMVVNLQDAKKNLSEEQFAQVYGVYLALREKVKPIRVDFSGYIEMAVDIVLRFDRYAPYEMYSGGDPEETRIMMQELREK